ncbi:MAG: hypothetical protein LDL11_08170 [Desulfarculus sp.]|nr:hypothetical protein [Desulfarculus sp.]
MEVWMDGKPLAVEPRGANLGEMLDHLLSGEELADRTLVELKVNGRPYELSQQGPAGSLPREAIDHLELETMDARQVALHFLDNARAYLQAMTGSLPQVAELFRVADDREANQQYSSLLETLHLFLQLVDGACETLRLDSAQGLDGLPSLAQSQARLNGLISEMLQSQEQEDWILLADILEHDLRDELQAWSELMPRLRRQAH